MTDFYEWNGQTYRGAKAVAEAAGVTTRRVYRHLETHGDLRGLTGNALHWRGREFRSAAAVAEAAGVSRHTVYWHLREHGNLSRIGEKPGGKSTALCKPIQIGTRQWESRAALARHIGVKPEQVYRWLSLCMMDDLLSALMLADARCGGRWGGKSGAAATCGRRDGDSGLAGENRGCA